MGARFETWLTATSRIDELMKLIGQRVSYDLGYDDAPDEDPRLQLERTVPFCFHIDPLFHDPDYMATLEAASGLEGLTLDPIREQENIAIERLGDTWSTVLTRLEANALAHFVTRWQNELEAREARSTPWLRRLFSRGRPTLPNGTRDILTEFLDALGRAQRAARNRKLPLLLITECW